MIGHGGQVVCKGVSVHSAPVGFFAYSQCFLCGNDVRCANGEGADSFFL